ncbi:MAG: JAB domain-containing protein [Rikenellaceae bacterium]
MEKPMDEISECRVLIEKLAYGGARSLSDLQLLAVLLGKGEVKETHLIRAKQLMNKYHSLDQLFACEKLPLTGNTLNLFNAIREIAQRVTQVDREVEIVDNNHDAELILRPLFASADGEEFWVVTLNRSGRVTDKRCISKGGITSSIVDIKLLMKYVLGTLAASIIVAHNHPSGDVEPSGEDLAITQKLVGALSFFDIKLLDHIIIGKDRSYSMREKGNI